MGNSLQQQILPLLRTDQNNPDTTATSSGPERST